MNKHENKASFVSIKDVFRFRFPASISHTSLFTLAHPKSLQTSFNGQNSLTWLQKYVPLILESLPLFP